MNDEDRDRFSALMALMAEVYGPLSALKIQAYWMALSEFPWSDVEAAALRCIQTRRTSAGFPPSWPTPGDLIALMWDQHGEPPRRAPQRALAEPPCDPAVARGYLSQIRELLDRLTTRVQGIPPTVDRDEEPAPMSEDNWRARWYLSRRDPDYKVLADAIPERLRIKFAEEDRRRKKGEGGQNKESRC